MITCDHLHCVAGGIISVAQLKSVLSKAWMRSLRIPHRFLLSRAWHGFPLICKDKMWDHITVYYQHSFLLFLCTGTDPLQI
jgi:hypothetical protein